MAAKFSQALFDRICEQLGEGKSLRTICKADDMPSQTAFFKWLKEKPALVEQYTRAREAQADALFEEILDIADDGTNDLMLRGSGDDEIEVVNHENIQRSRLRVDARKWMAGKLAPKKYGDKIDANITGTLNITGIERKIVEAGD